MKAPSARDSGFAYQPALDGVRAVAVSMVLLFHQGWLGGGYLGVSVFFTLSGYLITSLSLAEHERTGRLDVGAFYGRRLRRLLPASLACLAGVVALAAVGLFDGVAGLRRDIWGSLAQVYNWVALAGGQSYADLVNAGDGAASPLEHYWSLAIEEQFYWVWPVVLVVVLRAGRRGRLLAVGAMAAATALAAPLIAAVVGPRRRLLGDAGPPGRDPRRGPAGRRPLHPSRRAPPPGGGLAGGRPASASSAGRPSRGRADPARPTGAGCRCSPWHPAP